MENKHLLGIIIGSLVLLGISYYSYLKISLSPEAATTEITQEITSTAEISAEATPSPVPEISPSPQVWATIKPSIKPTVKPTSTATPTPTPKPLRDFYVQSHSQILIPEQTNATEYVETQTISRQRLEVDFAANNVSAGDTVVLRIYEDGSVKKEETRVFPSNNNVFVEVYYPMQTSPGTHTVKMVFNENHAIPESNYDNNEFTFTYKIIAETTPPSFDIRGPELINGQTCLTVGNLSDNKSVYTDVWAKWKIDDGNWSAPQTGTDWGCISGVTGSTHTYYVHAEDFRGNVKEDSKVFTLY